jgi:RNA polymerase sigma factor (sigma-70 family)
MAGTPNRTPLTDEQSELVARYFPLALKLARLKASGCLWLLEDFQDAAIDSLIGAARSFDPDVLFYFGHLARKSIRLALMKRHGRLGRRARLARFIPLDRWNEPATFNPTPVEPIAIDSMLMSLSERHREAIKLRFQEGLSLNNTARRMKVGHARVSTFEREALETLRAFVTA